jgi:hypothetical protein
MAASHIVPWAEEVNFRLDPANGLFLFTLYDDLFDKGYISFTDELKVIISPVVNQCGPYLQEILKKIYGKQAERTLNGQLSLNIWHITGLTSLSRKFNSPRPQKRSRLTGKSVSFQFPPAPLLSNMPHHLLNTCPT